MTDKSYFDYLTEIASMMEINHQCIYDEKTCQKWRVCSYIDKSLIHNIEIDIIEYPQSNAPEVYPTYKLLQQLNPISQHIHLHLDKMGKIISIVNNQEIEDKWTEIKDALVSEYGDVKQGKKMIEKLSITYYNFIESIKKSLLHLIFLMRYRKEDKFKVELPSVLNEGYMIDVDMKCAISDGGQQCLQGQGYVQHRASMMEKYEKQIRPLTQCRFDYNFNIEAVYGFNTDRILQNIEVQMQEQSCENLIHTKKITFTNLIIN